MLTSEKFEQHCVKLVDPSITPQARKELATEVRDSIELVHSQEYGAFVSNFLPAFRTVLKVLTTPQTVDNIEQKTRAVILEVLNRLPHNDMLGNRFLDIFALAMEILQTDNEDNAVTALRIVFDLHKNYRHHLGSQVQPFLDFVRRLYESFAATVNTLFIVEPQVQANSAAAQHITPSSQSFKVMTECPLLVMFLFQLYPNFIKSNIELLIPLMVRAIAVEVPANVTLTSKKSTYQEFIAAQVKTVSFLAYLLKQFPDFMQSVESSIPRSVVRLLQACPGDSITIRKELLVATRHILGSSFRNGFFGQIDLLLDERVLVGTGRVATDTLRPLAYSFLAELVHCVRYNLSVVQLEKVISLFSTNIHDPKFSYALQTSSVRLLLNLIEPILKLDNARPLPTSASARELHIRIMETMVSKYKTMGGQVPRLLSYVEELRVMPDPVATGKRLSEVPIADPIKEISDFKSLLRTLTLGLKTVIWSAITMQVAQPVLPKSVSQAAASLSDNGAAAVPQTAANAQSARPPRRMQLLETECETISALLFAGRQCFRLYSQLERANGGNSGKSMDLPKSKVGGKSDEKDRPSAWADWGELDLKGESRTKLIAATGPEERDIYDQFAQIFTVLDVRSFQNVFGLRMPDLFEHIVENSAALTVPQHFLANTNISKYFADILLNFLVENLNELDVPKPQTDSTTTPSAIRAQSFLKLFKILFASVSLFPTNEPVLRLHLGTIVRGCLNCAATSRDPYNYLQLLRALFKAITNGKHELQFELLYRDFMPLVKPLFTGLLALYQGPNRLLHRELIIELCLMIPARPSTLFPHLELQIGPIVWALEGSRENIGYGLRTLEFWVDILQPGYMDSLLPQVEPELTNALRSLLRPPMSTVFGAAALRILGKLGSKSRNHHEVEMPFCVDEYGSSGQQVHLSWADGSTVQLETDKLIKLCADAILDKRPVDTTKATDEHKMEASRFLFCCLIPFLGINGKGSDDSEQIENTSYTGLWNAVKKNSADKSVKDDTMPIKQKSKESVNEEANLVTTILVSLITAAGLPAVNKCPIPTGLNTDPEDLEFRMRDVCRYFAMLSVQECERKRFGDQNSSSTAIDGEANPVLKFTLFLDAIVTTLAFERKEHSHGGLTCLSEFVSALLEYCITVSDSTKREMLALRAPGRDITSNEGEDNDKATKPTNSAAPEVSTQTRSASPASLPTSEKTDRSDMMQIDTVQKRASPNDNTSKKSTEGGSDGTADASDLDEKARRSRDEWTLVASLSAVVDRLCHCCYQRSWSSKWAGAYGLGTIVEKIPEEIFVSPYLAASHFQIARALLFVIRDSSENTDDVIVEKARKILYTVLKMCFARNPSKEHLPKSVAARTSKVLKEITLRLTMELTCDSGNARATARQSFKILAETMRCDIVDILLPVKEHILRPLQQRSIRQHPFPVQIGYVEAMVFCLQLGKPILSTDLFSTPLRNLLLSEVIGISEDSTIEKLTEAEEGIRHKLIENNLIQPVVVKHLVQLRRNSIELLCSVAIHCRSLLQDPSNDDLFRRMVSTFFKSLQSRDPAIVESAKRGLDQAISKLEKPKGLLQQNLRPILGNLADYKKLTIPYLQGLSRVLGLFSHWFNVSLGEKLLEHLQRWTEPEKLVHLKRWTPGTESRVGAAILDLFHELPRDASKFLEQIVYMVLRLESVLAVAGPGIAHLGLKSAKASSTSPYRAPLLKYCNFHAGAAANFFLDHLCENLIRQLFFVMLRATESIQLRKELMDNPSRLVSASYLSESSTDGKALYSISLINLLSLHDPSWLGKTPDIMSRLIAYWKVISSSTETSTHNALSTNRVREIQSIAEIFIRYGSKYSGEVDILFELLPVFAVRTACDFTFVKDFLKKSVTGSNVSASREAVITKFLSLFQDKAVSQERKVHALQFIVIPMISDHLTRRKDVLNPSSVPNNTTLPETVGSKTNRRSSIEPNASVASTAVPMESDGGTDASEKSKITAGRTSGIELQASQSPSARSGNENDLLGSKGQTASATLSPDEVFGVGIIQRIVGELLDPPDVVLRNYDEPLSAELLQLATLLIQHMPTDLGRFRKELIRFGWNHLKREDSIAKQWAFVNVSRFFEAYQAPSKIILQVYVALLRACQGDGRELVAQALDVLTPALPLRLVHNPKEHKYPIWIRYTKKILLEEGHSIPNLVHIWQLIARHSELFYVARAQFVPIMVNSLSRIGLNATTAVENRRLALDIVQLILTWERRRRSVNPQKGNQTESQESNLDISKNGARKRSREIDGQGDPASQETSKEDIQTMQPNEESEPPTKMRKNSESKAIPITDSPTRASVASGSRESDEFRPTSTMVDILLNFIVQVPFRTTDRRERPLIMKRCIKLLEEALQLWPEGSVRLGFIEKLLNLPAAEKPGTSAAPNTNKNVPSQASSIEAGVSENKGTKVDIARREKIEQARVDRNVARQAALSTALTLASTLLKYQGKSFVAENIGALRALVLPAVTDNVVQTASQFATLLTELLRICPRSNSFRSNTNTQSAQKKSADVENSTKRIENTSSSGIDADSKSGTGKLGNNTTALANKNTVARKSESGQGTSPNGKENLPKSDSATRNISEPVSKYLYSVVNEAIERCLKATDGTRNHCGLLVLQAFTKNSPSEFIRFQDLLTKALHRMAKENLNSTQPSSGNTSSVSGSTTTNGAVHRLSSSKDRPSSTAAAANLARGASNATNPVPSDAQSHDSGRSSKNQAGGKPGGQSNHETKSLILCLSLLGENIASLEQVQRKTLFQVIWALIDRCVQVEVLLEIVRIIGGWVLCKSRNETGSTGLRGELTLKEKVNVLHKMVVFERIAGNGAQKLMNAFLSIILKIFGREHVIDRRPELLPKLEREFMLGLKTSETSVRQQFFRIYDSSVGPSLVVRLNYVIAKQEWEHLSDTLWIKQATEFLVSAVQNSTKMEVEPCCAKFSALTSEDDTDTLQDFDNPTLRSKRQGLKIASGQQTVTIDYSLKRFCDIQQTLELGVFIKSLQALLHHDSEFAYCTWVTLIPQAWNSLSPNERMTMEKAISVLLTKDYHQSQTTWARNNIQALLDAMLRCSPLPPLPADLVFHLGSRWNAWHLALEYLDKRADFCKAEIERGRSIGDMRSVEKSRAEIEDIANAQGELYRSLHEKDYFIGLWKQRASSPLTKSALTYEQLGLFANAQDVYSGLMGKQVGVLPNSAEYTQSSESQKGGYGVVSQPSRAEILLWEERWIDCARNLCQWEVLTEFSRTIVNSELMHECFWRVPDWSALKELLIKNPIEDGPQLKLYQAYVQLQENKLDVAENFIMQGYQSALEKYCSLPTSADLDATSTTLIQFQQLVELQESERILSELNALSKHGSGNINVEQKIENVRQTLNAWRERLPSQHENLSVWNDILTWRNHVHAVVVNVLEALKEAASAKVAAAQGSSSGGTSGARNHGGNMTTQAAQIQAAAAIAQALPQQVLVMGINETAWNVHRFAKTCRKQGYPDVALYALQKLYPFGTMELTEYFVKTKETARSYMAGPRGLDKGIEYGLYELNRCNMDHFNARQKAQLFTVKGKLCLALNREDDAVDAFSTALSTSSDVASAWLAWGRHCDKLQEQAAANPLKFAKQEMTDKNPNENESAESGFAAELAWREAAANCYLQALRFGSRKTRSFLPRVLRLLSLDAHTRLSSRGAGLSKPAQASDQSKLDATQTKGRSGVPELSGLGHKGQTGNKSDSKANPLEQSTSEESLLTSKSGAQQSDKPTEKLEGVAKVITTLMPETPTWMWLPWLSQIVPMLGRSEGPVIRQLLIRLAEQYPQAVFFPIRAYMEERKPIDRPVKHLSKEALKLSRPITSALLPAASFAQLNNFTRQAQQAKENMQRTHQRVLMLREELKKADAVILNNPNSVDRAAHLEKKIKLQDDVMKTHSMFAKYEQAYKLAEQRQRHYSETAQAAHGPGNVTSAANARAAGTGKNDGTNSADGTRTQSGERRVGEGLEQSQGGGNAGSNNSNAATGRDAVAPSMIATGASPFEHADTVMAHIVKSHQLLYVEIERITMEFSYRMKPQREEHLLSLMNALLHRCYQYSMKMGKEVAPTFRSALEELSRMCFGTGTEGKQADQRLQSSSIADLKEAFERELAPQTATDFPTEIEAFICRLRRWKNIFHRRVEALPDVFKLENISRYLIEVHDSDVDVFGQYAVAELAEPSSEKQVKIAQFSADVRVIRRPSGPSRGISIIGTDGKKYDFMLETSINWNVQCTEERIAQIYRLLNTYVFGRDSEAYRRRIRLTAPTFIPTGARTRLVSDEVHVSSLADGLEKYLEKNGKKFDDPLMAFRAAASEAYRRRRSGGGEGTNSRAESIAARVEAYHAVCNEHVSEECMSRWIVSKMPNASANFMLRKRLCESLGSASLVSYALAIGARRAQNLLLCWKTGRIYNLHMRSLISGRGVIESDEAVPFRLTRNIRYYVGRVGLCGALSGCMGTTWMSMGRHEELLRVYVDFIMRDEIMSWMTSEAGGGGSSGSGREELENRLAMSVEGVVGRVAGDREAVAAGVYEVIERASRPENVAQMEASWQAWY